jgi:hypothetical protein
LCSPENWAFTVLHTVIGLMDADYIFSGFWKFTPHQIFKSRVSSHHSMHKVLYWSLIMYMQLLRSWGIEYDKKLERIWFFGVKSCFFTRNTPIFFAPPSARRNFFKCAPPNLKSWLRPCYRTTYTKIRSIEAPIKLLFLIS